MPGRIVAVPVSWAVLRQAEADRGEATPDAAVNVYVLQMSSGEEIGLSRVLAARRHDELLRQWRQYRGEMERANVPSKLETVGPIDVEDQDDDRATVTAQVRPTWWNEQANLSGTANPWRFETRRDSGAGVGSRLAVVVRCARPGRRLPLSATCQRPA